MTARKKLAHRIFLDVSVEVKWEDLLGCVASPRKLCLLLSLCCSSCSREDKTSVMVGRLLASEFRHWRIISANSWASSMLKLLPSLLSITWGSRSLLLRYGLAWSARFSNIPFENLSTAEEPDKISSSTTPKLYTSDFNVRCPVGRGVEGYHSL